MNQFIKLSIIISPCLLFIVLFKWIYWQYYIIPYDEKQPSGFGVPDSYQNYGIYGFYFIVIWRTLVFISNPNLSIEKYFTIKSIGGTLLALFVFYLIAENIVFAVSFIGSFTSIELFEDAVMTHVFIILIVSFLIVKLIVDKVNDSPTGHDGPINNYLPPGGSEKANHIEIPQK